MLHTIKSVFATINDDCAAIRAIQEQHTCTKVYLTTLLYAFAAFVFLYGYISASAKVKDTKDDEDDK